MIVNLSGCDDCTSLYSGHNGKLFVWTIYLRKLDKLGYCQTLAFIINPLDCLKSRQVRYMNDTLKS